MKGGDEEQSYSENLLKRAEPNQVKGGDEERYYNGEVIKF